MEPLDYYRIEDELAPEDRAIRDRVRDFLQAEVAPQVKQAQREGAYLFEGMAEALGAQGVFAPQLQGYGCPGRSIYAYGLIMQELERVDSGLRSLASVQGALAMYAIYTFGDEAQKQRWLPELAAGRAIASFALTERLHGSDPGGMETVARRVGDEYVLNGNKCWIGNGSIADVRVVWAKNEEGKVDGYLVERGAPGLRAVDIEGKHSLTLSRTSELWFEECRIPAANKLPGAKGLKAALTCLGEARFGIAWGVIGAAQDCYQSALEYTKARTQFDRPLAGFQLVQGKLAEMVTDITHAQLVALQLTRLKERGLHRPQQISLAKRANVGMALRTARTARDMLGGVGITDEFPVFRHMVNLETVNTYEGIYDIHTLVLGNDVSGLSAFG